MDIISPLPGIFYRRPGPGKDPYVNEGDSIVAGQTIRYTAVLTNEGALPLTNVQVRDVFGNNFVETVGDQIGRNQNGVGKAFGIHVAVAFHADTAKADKHRAIITTRIQMMAHGA